MRRVDVVDCDEVCYVDQRESQSGRHRHSEAEQAASDSNRQLGLVLDLQRLDAALLANEEQKRSARRVTHELGGEQAAIEVNYGDAQQVVA